MDGISRRIIFQDDLNYDGFLDFAIMHEDESVCDKHGCKIEILLTNGAGKCQKAGSAISWHTEFRAKPNNSTKYKNIFGVMHRTITNDKSFSVFEYKDGAYVFSRYEWCGGSFDFCDVPGNAKVINPFNGIGSLYSDPNPRINKNAKFYGGIFGSQPEVGLNAGALLGEVEGYDLYLVHIFKATVAFVGKSDVKPF